MRSTEELIANMRGIKRGGVMDGLVVLIHEAADRLASLEAKVQALSAPPTYEEVFAFCKSGGGSWSWEERVFMGLIAAYEARLERIEKGGENG